MDTKIEEHTKTYHDSKSIGYKKVLRTEAAARNTYCRKSPTLVRKRYEDIRTSQEEIGMPTHLEERVIFELYCYLSRAG